MAGLTSLRLAGWKSIKDATLELRPLNVLIGANGSGKSNLISFFKMLNEMIAGRFQMFVGVNGGSESLMFFGSRRTQAIEADFRIAASQGEVQFWLRLIRSHDYSLIIAEEILKGFRPGLDEPDHTVVNNGHLELHLRNVPEADVFWEKLTRDYLKRCVVFHFHDTSLLGPMRRDCYIDANRFLQSDAGNLAAMLYLYRERYTTVYHRIVAAVKSVAPFIDEFILEPLRLNPRNIKLNWRAKGSVYEFGPHQFSDGTLRAIALFTLLLQPDDDFPEMIILDEPELGLHPAALAILAELIKRASAHCQVMVATQSTALLDHFDAEDVVVTNSRDGCSTFERLDPDALREWLEDFQLSNLWERNVIGGGPY